MDSGSGEVVTSPTPAKVASGDGEQQPQCLGLAVVGGILYSILSPKASPDVPRLANPVQLTSAIGVEDYPTWSADGGRLAYQSQQSGNGDIWVTQPGGGQPVNRTAGHTGRDCYPSWSPDGSQIAFWSDRDGGGYFVMSALGGAARKVISSQRFSSPPQWSADGEELAGLVTDGFVEIVSMRTRESRRLAVPSEMTAVMDLSWSSDGRFFAFVDGNPNLGRDALVDGPRGRRAGLRRDRRSNEGVESQFFTGWKSPLLRLQPGRKHGPMGAAHGAGRGAERQFPNR